MITAYSAGDKISSSSQEAFSMYEKSHWGEKKNGKIIYSTIESLYLVSEKKMELYYGKKKINEESLMSKLKKKDKKINVKFSVFADLRRKGYIVKTALKFGAEFRVYDKGVKPGEDHAKWVLYTVGEGDKISWHDFAAKNRVAHSTKKNLLIGLVDEEGGVSYYEVEWRKV